ncbi:MAG: type II toxin-antitoxin system VapC family toxin [Candidatus Rokubacteria bacterium]|nr:type II toxin-antitoxin system VapC family toxin [Candidatus Rokubacteria bacterium]
MRLYLDTSALVKLYVDEEGSPVVRSAVDQAGLIATSAIAYVEARAAFVRRRHEGGLSAGEYRRVIRDLDADWARYLVVEVTGSLIREAARLAEAHRLRAYDAVYLACAAAVHGRLAEPVVLASWDLDLESVARKERFELLRSRR